jgi:hypothetical protein
MLGTTNAELSLAAKLEAAGFNVPAILNSVHSNACDQSSALWHLLLAKQNSKEEPTSTEEIHIKLQDIDQIFEEAQRTPVSANPLLNIVSITNDLDDLQHSDPMLCLSSIGSRKSKKDRYPGSRPQSAGGTPRVTTIKKSKCLEEGDESILHDLSPLGESFSANYKPRPHSAGALRPPSARRKVQHDIEELSPVEDSPVDENVRPIMGASLKISEHMRKNGIQEEEEPVSPFQ